MLGPGFEMCSDFVFGDGLGLITTYFSTTKSQLINQQSISQVNLALFTRVGFITFKSSPANFIDYLFWAFVSGAITSKYDCLDTSCHFNCTTYFGFETNIDFAMTNSSSIFGLIIPIGATSFEF